MYGEAYQHEMKRALVSEKPLPTHLIPPEVFPGFEPWIEAFWELSTDRQIGSVLGPIPAASIHRHVMGWCEEEADLFRVCIRFMDRVFLSEDRDPDPVESLPGEKTDFNPARDSFRASMRRKT